jgi:hypothetical protein
MQGPSENGDNKNFRKKVKSLLLPKDATNFSMRFAFVGKDIIVRKLVTGDFSSSILSALSKKSSP